MEGICKKASHLDSLLKNMQWVKSLLQVLSERKDLSDEVRSHCSEKSKNIDKHIEKLRRGEKKSEEAEKKEANTEQSNSQIVKTPGEILLKACNNMFPPQQDSELQNSNSSKEKTPEEKFQDRYIATHGDGTSDQSDGEEWEP